MEKPAERILYGEPPADGATPFWRMLTLWSAAEGHPVTTVAIDDLPLLDEVVWFGGPRNVRPTVRLVAERARDIFAADLDHPIIMTRAGDVLDGAHRIARAFIDGRAEIRAVVIDDWPEPDGFVRPAE